MRIVVAPDSFKGSLTAIEVAAAIRRGLARALPNADIHELPLADGGEGFVAAMVAATDGDLLEVPVHDPLGRPIVAAFGLTGDGSTAMIEMAAASGLPLLATTERDPLQASTVGTGELIAAALDRGVSRILVGIGGSATVDGGVGMATALGYRFLDAAGEPIQPTGGDLGRLAAIDAAGRDPRLCDVRVEVACDVDNPLVGPRGAAVVFGPQKGATHETVDQLDTHLAHLAAVVRRDLGIDVLAVPGAGAAGGLGAGLLAFLDADLRAGVDVVLDHVGFEGMLRGADLVVTGEGRLDQQTLHGKLPAGVARRASALGCPVIAFAGSLGDSPAGLNSFGIECYFTAIERIESEAEAFDHAAESLARLAEQVGRALRLGSQLGRSRESR